MVSHFYFSDRLIKLSLALHILVLIPLCGVGTVYFLFKSTINTFLSCPLPALPLTTTTNVFIVTCPTSNCIINLFTSYDICRVGLSCPLLLFNSNVIPVSHLLGKSMHYWNFSNTYKTFSDVTVRVSNLNFSSILQFQRNSLGFWCFQAHLSNISFSNKVGHLFLQLLTEMEVRLMKKKPSAKGRVKTGF